MDVLTGDFLGFGSAKDAQTPCWLLKSYAGVTSVLVGRGVDSVPVCVGQVKTQMLKCGYGSKTNKQK